MSKGVARQMGCWIRPDKTVVGKVQVKRALAEDKNNFFESDFFATTEQQQQIFSSQPPINSTKLLPSEYPYKLDQQLPILRKVTASGARNLYFEAKSFFRDDNGQVFAKGRVLKLWYKRNSQGVPCNKVYNKSLYALELYRDKQYVPLEGLHWSNDFLFKHPTDDSDVAGWLLEWIL